MKYAIISAGEGSRLAKEGLATPKPLVRVGEECLIDRLVGIFTENGATEIVIITREAETEDSPMRLVAEHLRELKAKSPVPIVHIQKATPSSMHSFYELSRYLKDEPFVLTTVDTYFRETEFKGYVEAFVKALTGGYDGLMGVTDYIDDEKPLYVTTDERMNITAYLDTDTEHRCRFISAGVYGLAPRAITTLERCIESGQSRMRNFQRALINDGNRLLAYTFTKAIDIDHITDIDKANENSLHI